MEPASSPSAPHPHLDPERLARAHALLERERQRHLARRAILLDQISRGRERNAEGGREEAGHSEDRMLLARLVEGHRVELAAIASATERLRRGSYGWCERCGLPISRERLEVMPAAAQCLPCQVSHPASGPRAGRRPTVGRTKSA